MTANCPPLAHPPVLTVSFRTECCHERLTRFPDSRAGIVVRCRTPCASVRTSFLPEIQTVEQILADYPCLERDDVLAALAYRGLLEELQEYDRRAARGEDVGEFLSSDELRRRLGLPRRERPA